MCIYLPEESKVIYEPKDGKEEKIFDVLDRLKAMTSHVPNKGEQTVCYYDHYSNASRGLRPPPKVKTPSVMISIDDSDSQVPFSTSPFYPDPDYPMDSYVN
jgi:hypothetical protein